ncbi:hypothetical protein [Pelagibius marinus]|uniref:hypothetical protein n=1 Tax=Pelagibius marinus TaxID=2762760 RepID=UPI0018722924|nr:hypothetical protein [Pelagibius marinus]
MSDTTYTDFGSGAVLSQSLQVFGRNCLPFIALALLLISPAYLLAGWLVWEGNFIQSIPPAALQFGLTILESLLGFIVHAAVVYGTFRDLRGQKTGFAANFAGGFGSVVPVLAVAIVSGLIVIFGLFLLVVPGLIFAAMYWVAVPAAVVEKTGVKDSLSRSAALTSGERWKVFGIIVIIGFAQVFFERGIDPFLDYENALLLSMAITLLYSASLTAFGAVASAVTYHQLRRVKEGTGVEEIAAVFD